MKLSDLLNTADGKRSLDEAYIPNVSQIAELVIELAKVLGTSPAAVGSALVGILGGTASVMFKQAMKKFEK